MPKLQIAYSQAAALNRMFHFYARRDALSLKASQTIMPPAPGGVVKPVMCKAGTNLEQGTVHEERQ